MAGFLQKLRRKTPETRKRIALGTSAAVTSLVFVMWITVINNGFIDAGPVDSLNSETTQTASPLSAFGDNANSAFSQLRDSLRFEASSATTSSSSASEPTATDNQPPPAEEAANYWEGKAGQRSQEQMSDNNSAADAESESSAETSFTSRDYNPNEESDWFAE
jgi:hypothetical protein